MISAHRPSLTVSSALGPVSSGRDHPSMSVTLHIDGHRCAAHEGASILSAPRRGVKVPTSCLKQGRCKECLVEVTEGMECLSAPLQEERHLSGNFRLACCARIVRPAGVVRCHTMRRGTMRIEREAFQLPGQGQPLRLDPAVTRDGDSILLDGVEIDRGSGPLHGLALDLGTTTVVLRLLEPRDRRGARGLVVRESPAVWRVGRDGADPLRHQRRRQLLQHTLAGYLRHAIEELPVDPHSIYEVVVVGNSTMRDLFFGLSVYSIGQSPYQSITEIDFADGPLDHDQPRRAGPVARAAAPPAGKGIRPANHQRACRGGRGRLHAGGRSGQRGTPGGGHGHRHQHGTDCRQPAQDLRRLVSCRAGVRGRADRMRDAGPAGRDRTGGDRRPDGVVATAGDRRRAARGHLRLRPGRPARRPSSYWPDK